MKKYTKIISFALIMFTNATFGMQVVKQEGNAANPQAQKMPEALPARLLEHTNQSADKVIPTAEFYWKKCGNLPLKTYLKMMNEGTGMGKKIPINLMDVGWDEIIKRAQQGMRFSIEVMGNSQQKEWFTICSVEIRDAARMSNRGHFTYKLQKIVPVQQQQNVSCIQRSDRVCTHLVHRHSNKIAGAIIFCMFVCLWKYHTFLFFYPH